MIPHRRALPPAPDARRSRVPVALDALVPFAVAVLLLLAPFAGSRAAASPSTQAAGTQSDSTAARTAPAPTGSFSSGAALFAGAKRFQNGGPPCATCHRVAGIGFPDGGTLGPDLTGGYAKLSPQGMQYVLQTLFFPTMAPIFDSRALTQAEQADLDAFFAQTASSAPQPDRTPLIVGSGVVVFLVLLLVTALGTRRRLGRVRRQITVRGA